MLLFTHFKRILQKKLDPLVPKLEHAFAALTFVILSQLYININIRALTSTALGSYGIRIKQLPTYYNILMTSRCQQHLQNINATYITVKHNKLYATARLQKRQPHMLKADACVAAIHLTAQINSRTEVTYGFTLFVLTLLVHGSHVTPSPDVSALHSILQPKPSKTVTTIQRLHMVLGHLSHKIHNYSFDTDDLMFFVISFSIFSYSGVVFTAFST
jgi:hypothetical protein